MLSTWANGKKVSSGIFFDNRDTLDIEATFGDLGLAK
jgi:hypothetical protein